MNIKLCEEKDIELLEREIPSPGQSKFHIGRLKLQKDGTASYLIAWHNEKPVGHLLVKWNGFGPVMPKGLKDIPELNSFEVAENSRGNGIGTSLIKAAEDLAKQKGIKTIGLLVNHDNLKAKLLYERLGYHDSNTGTYVDEWEAIDDSGNKFIDSETCLAMIRNLTDFI
jgi:ribosomal protein S18 acetylase RimI-like enzyme